jgi:hypothetical protein
MEASSTRLLAQSWNRIIPDLHELSFAVPRSIVESIAALDGRSFDEARPEPFFERNEGLLRELERWSSSYLDLIRSAPGLVILQLPGELSDAQLRAGYALISRSLGALNDRYGYLFDVKDYGLDHTKQAVPVSKTRAATGFHTDSTAREYLPDIVGLLCIDPGWKGGASLIANAADVYRFIRQARPQLIEPLSEPLYRDVITPGTTNNVQAILNNRFPVFSVTDEGLTYRYMRYWIEIAYQKTGREMPAGLMDAMDLMDGYMNDPANHLVFQLKRGGIFYLNNRFLCHSRTAFEDDPATHRIRTLVRTWINLAP